MNKENLRIDFSPNSQLEYKILKLTKDYTIHLKNIKKSIKLSFNEIMANVQSEYYSYFEKIDPIQISSLDQKINLDGSTHDLESTLETINGITKKTIKIPLAFRPPSESSSIIESSQSQKLLHH